MRAHGTRSRYVQGCRCTECTEANATYGRRWMKAHADKQAARKAPWEAHGTTRGYHYYACRCDRCRAAVRAYKQQLRAKRAQTPAD